jgi:hypothetical protein
MREIELNYAGVVASLDNQIRSALGERFGGISTYGIDRPIKIFLNDTATQADEALVMGMASTPQPVWPKLDANYQSKAAGNREIKRWQSRTVKHFWRQIS